MNLPLAADDLRAIADRLDALSELLLDTSTGAYVPAIDKDIGKVTIEITRPDWPEELAGYATLEDGWIGFRPKV